MGFLCEEIPVQVLPFSVVFSKYIFTILHSVCICLATLAHDGPKMYASPNTYIIINKYLSGILEIVWATKKCFIVMKRMLCIFCSVYLLVQIYSQHTLSFMWYLWTVDTITTLKQMLCCNWKSKTTNTIRAPCSGR